MVGVVPLIGRLASKKGKTLLTKSTKGPIHTRKQVAEAAGVSEDTVRKVEIIEQEATEEVKQREKTTSD
jgi:hypothetical protein